MKRQVDVLKHIGRFWREVILGIFFLDGLFASLQINPLGSVFQMFDSTTAQLNQTIGTPVVDSSRIYVIASIILEVIGVVIGLIVAGLLGLIAIAIAYGSGYLLLGNPLIGIALFVLSAIFLFLGHRNKNKKRLYDGKNGKI